MFRTLAGVLLLVGILLGVTAEAAPTYIHGMGGFDAEVCLRPLILLARGEVATTPLHPLGFSNEVVVGTSKRILRVNWKTGEMILEMPVRGPVEVFSQSSWDSESPWMAYIRKSDDHGRFAELVNITTRKAIPLIFQRPDDPRVGLVPSELELDPSGRYALATFARSISASPVLFDIDKLKIHSIFEPFVPAEARSTFFNGGKQIAVILNSENLAGGRIVGYVLNTERIIQETGGHFDFFTLPPTIRKDVVPKLVSSAHDPLFAAINIEKQGLLETEYLLSRLTVYDATEGTNRSRADELPAVFSTLNKIHTGATFTEPYIPPVAFAPKRTFLVGTRDGTVEVRRLENNGKESFAELTNVLVGGHDDSPISSLATSNDGRYYASGAENGTIAVWEPALRLGYRVSTKNGSVKALHFSGDEEPSLLVEWLNAENDQSKVAPSRYDILGVPPEHGEALCDGQKPGRFPFCGNSRQIEGRRE